MRITTRGRYGVAAMFELAMAGEIKENGISIYASKPMPLKIIAGNQDIPEQYLEQLVSLLRKGALVESVRGAHGGYRLSRSPSEITIGDIIRSVEEPTLPVECVGENNFCAAASKCASRLVWQAISDSINQVIDNITLQDMIDDNKRLNEA